MKRISTLDGWRGIAILLVIAEHAGHERFPDQTWAQLGSLGVDIFFVLSGYIITARMLAESETGSISLRSFYVRRAFRILPLVLCYLTLVSALSLFQNMDIKPSQIAGALFFYRNYQFASHPIGVYTSHFWSLSVEEHFYLFWPAVLVWLGNKRAGWFAGITASLCAAWRLYSRLYPNSTIVSFLPGINPDLREIRTDLLLDSLLLGSLLAILLSYPKVRAFVFRNCPKEMPLVAGVLLMILNHPWAKPWSTLTYYSLLAIAIGSTTIVQEGLAYKFLNFRPLVWIGTISYSLYVWQQLFLQHPSGIQPLGILGRFPYNLVCATLIAIASYLVIEEPANRLGHMLAKRPDRLART